MKTTKSKKTKSPQSVDWRANLMKVLEVLYFEEATWAQSRWADYGITEKDKKLIEKEFEKSLTDFGKGEFLELWQHHCFGLAWLLLLLLLEKNERHGHQGFL
jgi:hypothetical protein